MVEVILVLGAIVVLGLIIGYTMEEKALDEAYNKALVELRDKQLASMEEDEDEDEDNEWYDRSEADSCMICEDVIYEGETVIRMADDNRYYTVICEYCLNPDLKD